MANVDVVNLTWDMINEKEGMIVYERTKFPKLAKPLLIVESNFQEQGCQQTG